MSILDAARQHFGARWKADIRVIGRQGIERKLNELQREIAQLQACFSRLQAADRREPNRGGLPGADIRVVSEKVESELVALHGWTVSLVETVLVLIGLESDVENELRAEWKRNM